MTMQRSASIDQRDLFDHAEFVRAVARRLLDEHRAEDVVQETMLVAHQRRASLRHDARGWLATVARNFARMSLRGEARRVARESLPPETAPIDTPDAVAARLETQRQVVDAVRSLPEKYRIVVTLRFFEGLSPVRIARRLGVPVKTVHTRLRRAFERLRDQLQGEHGEDHRAWALALVPLASLPGVRGYSTATSVGGGVWPVLQIPVLFLTIAAAFVIVGETLTSASVSRTYRMDGASTRCS